MKILAFLLFCVVVVACSPAQPVANGKTVYEIDCLDDEKFCDPRALELCPDGYMILRDKSHVVAIWRGMDVVNRIRFWLTIECK